MPTYISLVDFTSQGITNIKDTVQRAKAFKQVAEGMGVTVKAMYYTVGCHDMVVIGDAPDLETYSALALSTGSLGNVRTETLQAVSPEEMYRIIAKMP